ncbi:MAG: cytochrome c oxidase subunit 3 family protein [Oceanospirillaceae bacterium]
MLTSNFPILLSDSAESVASSEKKCKTPGSMAVWIFIYAELFEFGLFFIVFLIGKIYFPEDFYQGPSQLSTVTGLLNTLVLLSSSYFVVLAIRSIKRGRQKQTIVWLILTIIAGLTYCAIKTWEYNLNESIGITARTNYYFASYYYITFNHLLHVLIGTCTIAFVTVLTALGFYTQDNHEGLESAASYWHMIDLVWILIFPLIYVLR